MSVKYVAVIPARKGSKRIIKKNIKSFLNKPLIEHTFIFAKNSNLFDEIICSTNDEEVIKIADRNNIKVRIRPDELCTDQSGDVEIFQDVLEHCIDEENRANIIFVFLRPTSPFRKKDELEKCIQILCENDFSSVRSVIRVEGVHHPYWMFNQEENGLATPAISNVDLSKFYQSQLLPDTFRLTGTYDIFYSKNLVESQTLYGSKMAISEISFESSVDIDTPIDFKFAEFLGSESVQK